MQPAFRTNQRLMGWCHQAPTLGQQARLTFQSQHPPLCRSFGFLNYIFQPLPPLKLRRKLPSGLLACLLGDPLPALKLILHGIRVFRRELSGKQSEAGDSQLGVFLQHEIKGLCF